MDAQHQQQQQAHQQLRQHGVPEHQIQQLKALPHVNWGLLLKFVQDHAEEAQQIVAELVAIFGGQGAAPRRK